MVTYALGSGAKGDNGVLLELSTSSTLADLPNEDALRLVQAYETTPHDGLKHTPGKFVMDIGWRVYTEWCTSEESKWPEHRNYHGQALTKFIDDEVIYATDRAHCKGLLNEKVKLGEIRGRVLDAIVKRAVKLFSDWEGHTYPKCDADDEREDKRNLRTSLEPYLGF
jgi:hypothetical protein